MTHPSYWYKLPSDKRSQQIKEAVSLIERLGGRIYPYEQCPAWQKGLIPYIKTYQGILYVDLQRVHLGDLIHEFCHIWVVPDYLKPQMSGWLLPFDGGEEMAQAASYAIAISLDLEPWIVLSVVTYAYEYLQRKLETNRHEGIILLVENGLIEHNRFPNIFLT